MVARFLGLLELYRDNAVAFDQIDPLGELHVRWIGTDSGDLDVSDEFDVDDETDDAAGTTVRTSRAGPTERSDAHLTAHRRRRSRRADRGPLEPTRRRARVSENEGVDSGRGASDEALSGTEQVVDVREGVAGGNRSA